MSVSFLVGRLISRIRIVGRPRASASVSERQSEWRDGWVGLGLLAPPVTVAVIEEHWPLKLMANWLVSQWLLSSEMACQLISVTWCWRWRHGDAGQSHSYISLSRRLIIATLPINRMRTVHTNTLFCCCGLDLDPMTLS